MSMMVAVIITVLLLVLVLGRYSLWSMVLGLGIGYISVTPRSNCGQALAGPANYPVAF